MARVGRPLKFENVEELNKRIEAYFLSEPELTWTITGLALALDTSRETLMNYEEKPEFFDAIKKAKEMVHNAYEKDLRRKGRSGDIFALKNFGWTDQQQIDHLSGGKPFFLANDLMSKYEIDSSAKSDSAE